jgi:uncharacterized protein
MNSNLLEHPVEVRDSTIHGKGCYALAPIASDAYFLEYTGELINREKAIERNRPDSPDYSQYIMEVSDDIYIDALKYEHPAKYINHSCAPNCILATEGSRAFIVALRDIKPGEELTYDYDYDDDDEVCLCGAESCRKFI